MVRSESRSWSAGADPVRDQMLDHVGIGERRGVAEARYVALGDFPQDAAHDLAAAGLGQAGGELDRVGGGDRADLVADPVAQRLGERVVDDLVANRVQAG